MKTIIFIEQEWQVFHELATLRNLIYSAYIENGLYIVKADKLSLEHLGY